MEPVPQMLLIPGGRVDELVPAAGMLPMPKTRAPMYGS